MKKIIAFLLAAIMLLSLTACGEDPNEAFCGKYTLYAMETGGYTLNADDWFEGENYVELKKGGSAVFCIESESANVRWKLDGTAITLTAADGDMPGTLENGILKLDLDGDFLYYAAENANTAALGAQGKDDVISDAVNQALAEAGGKTDTPAPEGNEGGESGSETAAAGDANTFRVTAYTANGQTYSGQTIVDMGMQDTYFTMNEDHTGYICFSGEGFDVTWTDDGSILLYNYPYYTFTWEDDDTIVLSLYDTLFYTLVRETSAGAPAPVAKEKKGESKLEKKEEKKEEKQEETKPAVTATPGEPIPAGDGMCGEENVYRLMRWWDYMTDMGSYPTYEEMVAVAGCEAKDGGNDGPNSMTQYGDRIAFWYASDSSYVYYTFRRKDNDETWRARQWMAQNIDRAVWESADISDLLPKADMDSMQEQEFPLVAFMTDITTKVKISIPGSMWYFQTWSDDEVKAYNSMAEDNNAPRIAVSVQSSLERIDFYKDDFENLQDIPSRTIGGIEMTGRSYKNIGWEWTEYYAELPNSVWVSVKISRVDISDGSEGAAVLDSISFAY